MTAQALAAALAPCTVKEQKARRTPHGRMWHAEVVVEAPDGHFFEGSGCHAIIVNAGNIEGGDKLTVEQLRAFTVEMYKMDCPLAKCPVNCECGHNDEEEEDGEGED